MNDSKPRPEPNYQQEQEAREIVRLVQEAKMDTVLFVGSILAERDAALSRLAAEKDAESQERLAGLERVASMLRTHIENGTLVCGSCKKALASLPAPAEKPSSGEKEGRL